MKYKFDAPFNAVLLRYNEIGLKGGNRRMFENKLLANIRRKLEDVPSIDFYEDRGRFAIVHEDDSPFTSAEMDIINRELVKVFGIESFSPGFQIDSDWELIVETVERHFPLVYKEHMTGKTPDTKIPYRTRARRSYKKFPYMSREIEIQMAEILLSKYENLEINLSEPDLCVGIEIRDDSTFVYFETVRALGGLPVGSNDGMLALMSGGIDSPVACVKAMQRGSHVDYLTFHSHPYTSRDVLGKIGKLVNIVDEYQDKPGRYYACNLVEAQKMIRDRCIPKLRTVLYRRMMMRIATVVAHHVKCNALLTGESLGQVASQTVKNMDCINRSTDMLIVRPLVSFDKNETIEIARRIGTLDTSNIPAADSCTTFAPKKPATNANMTLIEKTELRLDMAAVIRLCLEDCVLIDSETMEEEAVPKLLELFDKHHAGNWPQSESEGK